MFTGIIEEIGYVKDFVKNAKGASLVIECNKILDDIKLGDSVCVNGVCETVTKILSKAIMVDISDETLDITNFKYLKFADKLNLERALTLNTRLGGHIVSGHIDCVGKLVSITKNDKFYNLEFKLPDNMTKYVVYKGSIAINGISLTIANIEKNVFSVAVIPHTFENTVLKFIKIGDYVNIETDIIAKYIEKLLLSSDNSMNSNSNISMDFLKENGYL